MSGHTKRVWGNSNELVPPGQSRDWPCDNRLDRYGLQSQFEMLLDIVDVVSFDLFDTLVQREGLFFPKDLFYRVQETFEKRLGLEVDDFVSVRIRAEGIARVRARGHNRQETTLLEIYSELARILALETNVAQHVMEIELECERAALTPLVSAKPLFEAALAAGKPVVIVSDTYFSEDFINEVVKQNGFSEIQKTYASSVYGRTKADGSLFEVVLKDMQCQPNRLIHIGDNKLSDVGTPLGMGIRALLFTTPKHQLKWRHGLNDGPSGSLVMSAMLCDLGKQTKLAVGNSDRQSVMARTAIHHLSLLYFGFSAWLLEQLKRGGYRRVYFAARDGQIIKRFFDHIATAAGFEIDSRYLYVSRAALYPSLAFTDPGMARRLFSHNWDHMTVGEALGRMSLSGEEVAGLLEKYGLPDSKLPLNRVTASKFSGFLDEIWPLFMRKSEERCQLLVEYLRQELLLTEEGAAFVDIGWHASLQHCVSKLLKHMGITKELSGFYLGTFAQPEGAAFPKANGFLVDRDKPQWISELVRSSPSLIELFHSAGHGSVLGYECKGTRVLPVLNNNSIEREQFLETIGPMQDLAFNFVAEHLKRLPGVEINASEPVLIARLALRVIYAPTAAEAGTFGSLRIATDFGGRMKSITGAGEWNLKTLKGEKLPDGTPPMWRPGFQAIKSLQSEAL